jgi:hypothetical protein
MAVKSPIAFLVFNRPELTARVFEEIRRAKPPLLLVVADGPRRDHPEDRIQCERVRAMIDSVDWPCEVRKNYAEVNLGCGKRVSSGIGWVFNEVEEAIIVEDDCLPHPTFFRFCEELLEKYRHDERIGFIGGVNFSFREAMLKHSYYFSRGHYIWGWASWRRAWRGYDFDMKEWPELRAANWLRELFKDPRVIRFYTFNFDVTYRHEFDTWDYQWVFHCWRKNQWEIMPGVNLVANIGHDRGVATHTSFRSKVGNVPPEAMDFPLSHPGEIMLQIEADRYNEVFRRMSLLRALKMRAVVGMKRAAYGSARNILGDRIVDHVKALLIRGPGA